MWLVRVAYDGSGFSGAAATSNGRTVAGEVRAACGRFGDAVEVELLSRTDRGAHAEENVVVLRGAMRTARLLESLERHLPEDLRPLGVARVEALPAVVSKRYRYQLDLTPSGDPFRARLTWRPPRSVDASQLPGLAGLLPGRRDLSAFVRRGETRVDLTRTVLSAEWSDEGPLTVFRIEADGFIYKLVRTLVGCQVAVASGALERTRLVAALQGVGPAPGHQAPARGLVLERVVLSPSPQWRELEHRVPGVAGVRSART